LKTAIAKCSAGVFELQDLPVQAPFHSIRDLFKMIEANPSLAERVNAAYTNNLVYKDAYGHGKGGANVDEKKVIDLSPARLDTIVSVDEDLAAAFGDPLAEAVRFFDQVRVSVAPRILSGLAELVGDDFVANDELVNYRMVDYPSRAAAHHRQKDDHGPRCGAHRDFGTFTIIFPDETPGLEVLLDDTWYPVTCSDGNSVVLLFGWCANIRSNDRVPAALHRVHDVHVDGIVPRRSSAVFFLAPRPDVALKPKLIGEDETPVYREVTAGDLKQLVGRRWKKREGTLAKEMEKEEVEEAKSFPTQDDIIRYKYRI